MPDIPVAVPNKALIRTLIYRRGDSISDFAQEIGVPRDRIWDITSRTVSRPVAIRILKPIARGLSTRTRPVRISDISDWDGDDLWDDEDELEPKIPAA